MRRRRPISGIAGYVCIALGILIIMAMVLPAGFWWIVLGVGLIALGVCWLRRGC